MRKNTRRRRQWVSFCISAAAIAASIPLQFNAREAAAKDNATALDALIQQRSYSEFARQLASAKLAH